MVHESGQDYVPLVPIPVDSSLFYYTCIGPYRRILILSRRERLTSKTTRSRSTWSGHVPWTIVQNRTDFCHFMTESKSASKQHVQRYWAEDGERLGNQRLCSAESELHPSFPRPPVYSNAEPGNRGAQAEVPRQVDFGAPGAKRDRGGVAGFAGQNGRAGVCRWRVC